MLLLLKRYRWWAIPLAFISAYVYVSRSTRIARKIFRKV